MEAINHRITVNTRNGPRTFNLPLFVPVQIGWNIGPLVVDGQTFIGRVVNVTIPLGQNYIEVEVSAQ